MYTSAGMSARVIDNLKKTSPSVIDAQQAFTDLKAMVRTICPDLAYLTVNTDLCLFTLDKEDGSKATLTAGQLKEALANVPGANLDHIETKIVEHIEMMRYAFKVAGYSSLPYYSPAGPDVLGSAGGGRALAVTEHSHGWIHAQQATHLLADIKKDKHAIAGLIDQLPESKRKEAVERVVHAETRALRLRNTVTEKVQELNTAYLAQPDESKKRELNRWKQLLNKLEDTNRHALWATAAFPEPAECYEGLLLNYYGVYCAQIEDKAKHPSFADFCEAPETANLKMYAAEIASTLISDPTGYRLFCHKHGIGPRDNHINRFLNQTHRTPPEIDFKTLGIDFNQEESKVATQVIGAAIQANADEIRGQLDLIDAKGPAKDMLKKAAKNLGRLLEDKTVPSTAARAYQAFKGLFS